MADVVDLRSDTITQPTPAMREAMFSARVGDDGSGEDPTVNELEALFAGLVAKPASVFVPSGVMANQIALRVLGSPGDLAIAGAHSHIVGFEMGAAARNSGVQFALVDDLSGGLDPSAVEAVLAAESHHQPRVGLLCLEDTMMYSGGSVLDASQLKALAGAVAGRPVHLDGARLFNAAIASGSRPDELASAATTVAACLSKGLCAPVGSLLAGPIDVIERARIERKRLGGSMRQAGFLAAAGLVALRTMVERLAEDHRRARHLAEVVAARFPESGYDSSGCRTNIVAFEHAEAPRLVAALAERGVLATTLSATRVRLVTHADLDDAMVERAGDVIATLR